MKYLILTFLSFAIHTNWVKNIEESIVFVDRNGKLENDFDEEDDYGRTILKKYITERETKIKVQYQYEDVMNFSVSYYENEKMLFAEIVKGQDILLYKRERLKNEPYAVLMETKTFFKTETQGQTHSRRINIYENSDIEKLKNELAKMEFEIKKIGAEEYENVKKDYNRVINRYK